MRFPDQADPPKLSLFSLPNKPNQEPPGTLTPPPKTSVSVPFQWEEAPGRPRPSTITDAESKPKSARSLDLPPRLLVNESNSMSNATSPTTVLDGPYMGKGGWLSSSFRRSPTENWMPKTDRSAMLFRSTRWGSFKKSTKEAIGSSFEYFSSTSSSLSSSSSSVTAAEQSSIGSAGTTKVNITRIKRRTSFMSFSDKSTRSHMWASIYDSFKHVVPWRRRH